MFLDEGLDDVEDSVLEVNGLSLGIWKRSRRRNERRKSDRARRASPRAERKKEKKRRVKKRTLLSLLPHNLRLEDLGELIVKSEHLVVVHQKLVLLVGILVSSTNSVGSVDLKSLCYPLPQLRINVSRGLLLFLLLLLLTLILLLILIVIVSLLLVLSIYLGVLLLGGDGSSLELLRKEKERERETSGEED